MSENMKMSQPAAAICPYAIQYAAIEGMTP